MVRMEDHVFSFANILNQFIGHQPFLVEADFLIYLNNEFTFAASPQCFE